MGESKFKILKAKLFRAIGVTKLIELDNYERQWIKLCKFHYKEKYPSKGEWTETMKPLFKEIYGWCPDEYYNDYLQCMFGVLLKIHGKIVESHAYQRELTEVFEAAFYKKFYVNQELPIERSIARLCGAISNNKFLECGVPRYSFELTKK